MSQTNTEQTLSLTVELPASAFQLLTHIAELLQESPEVLAAQSIVGNLPPSVENAPAEIQAELLAMQKLPVETLLEIAQSQVSPSQQARYLALQEKQEAVSLTPAERQELRDLRQGADQLMLRKAYAWAILRWRGQHIPPLDELPLE